MDFMRLFTLRKQLDRGEDLGTRFIVLSGVGYSVLLDSLPTEFKLHEDVCVYTAGWMTGAMLGSLILSAGKPRNDQEAHGYNKIAFTYVGTACGKLSGYEHMRGLTAEMVPGLTVNTEFRRGYEDAYKEVGRWASEGFSGMFFPIGFTGFRRRE